MMLSMRIIRLFGNKGVKRVSTTVGPEQEYFLVDKSIYEKRPDLVYCGRTLFGARPSKGQELEDHYFGIIKPRVFDFMKELDKELWKLGVFAKTEHNEVAPAQHELAPVYTTTNIAVDQNQLTMELMKTIANKHDLVCLLHEKPFAGVNGSGKHNNWSIVTDTGVNLLEPGETPYENAQFLIFLAAVIKAVDDYQDLLRIAVASAGNDHRLGANEAPPAIISMFLGDELTAILESIEKGTDYDQKQKTQMEIGAHVLPHFPKDTTDRNRTSPFAFTGNKFEFRMLGSAASVSGANVVLNSIVAEVLSQFADRLEQATNFDEDLNVLIKEVIKKHKRIIFNGNNYSDEWVVEAEKRGLLNLKSTPDAMPYFITKKNIDMFTKLGVFSEGEVHSRYEILLENYIKIIHIEALTMLDMVKRGVTPAGIAYAKDIADTVNSKKSISSKFSCVLEEQLLSTISNLLECIYHKTESLDNCILEAHNQADTLSQAKYYRETVFLNMQSLRGAVDELETLVGSKYWPYPTYGEVLYSVY